MITKIQNTDNYSYRYANFFMGGQARLTFLCQVQSMRKTKLTFPAFIQQTDTFETKLLVNKYKYIATKYAISL